ncbi:MAG: hypothetical protein K6G10_07010 [Butyrivibrio sp.]|nr:hypothetical protein [Butyrivibrio sp.]
MVTLNLISKKDGDTVKARVYNANGYDIKVVETLGMKSISAVGVNAIPQPRIILPADKTMDPQLAFGGDIFVSELDTFIKQAKDAAELAYYLRDHQDEL